MPPLTDQQEKILFLLPIFPSLLSLSCSIIILYIVYKNYQRCRKTKQQRTTVYHRLLVGMSLCDAFVSFWTPFSAFFLPADTSNRIWAIGTNGTCTFMGFLQSFIVVGMMYNTSLSFYFLLTARYGWRDSEVAKCVEPVIHLLVAVFPITCGLAYAFLGVYGEQYIGPACWVDDYPPGCGLDDSCITPLLGWIAAGFPVVLSFVSLFVNNALIYCHVRSTIQKVQRYSSDQFNNHHHNNNQHPSNHLSSIMMISRLSSIQSLRTLVNGSQSQPQQQLQQQQQQPQRRQDSHTRRLQSVASQAGLYLLVFLLNYIWTIILKNLGAQERYWSYENESELFWLLVLQSIFLPLQGFFNLCVFSRPKYSATRKRFPNRSSWWIFQRAMFGTGRRTSPQSNVSGLVRVSGDGVPAAHETATGTPAAPTTNTNRNNSIGTIMITKRLCNHSSNNAVDKNNNNNNDSKFLVAIEQGNEEEEEEEENDAFHQEGDIEGQANTRASSMRLSFSSSKRIVDPVATAAAADENNQHDETKEEEEDEPSFSHDQLLVEPVLATQQQQQQQQLPLRKSRNHRWGHGASSTSLRFSSSLLSSFRQSTSTTTSNTNTAGASIRFWGSRGTSFGLTSFDAESISNMVNIMDRPIKEHHFDAFLFGFEEEEEDEESSPMHNLHDQQEENKEEAPVLPVHTSLNSEEVVEAIQEAMLEADAGNKSPLNGKGPKQQLQHLQQEGDHVGTSMTVSNEGGGNEAKMSDHYCYTRNDEDYDV